MKLLIAYLSGIAASVLAAILLSLCMHVLNKEIALFSLGAGLLIFTVIVLQKEKISSGLEKKDFGCWSMLGIIAYVLFSLRAFLWLIIIQYSRNTALK